MILRSSTLPRQTTEFIDSKISICIYDALYYVSAESASPGSRSIITNEWNPNTMGSREGTGTGTRRGSREWNTDKNEERSGEGGIDVICMTMRGYDNTWRPRPYDSILVPVICMPMRPAFNI